MIDINKFKNAEVLIMARQKKNRTTGTCKHCGQQMIIHLPEGWDTEDKTQEEYDELATEQCECSQAQKEAENATKKAAAIKRITEYYDSIIARITGQDDLAAKERQLFDRRLSFMISAIEAVTEGTIAAAGIRISESETMSIGYKANGDLQIKRMYKGTEEWLF